MFEYLDQLIVQKELTTFNVLIRIGYSFFLGALVGIERQSRRNAAGIRTFSLIAVGSCLAMLASLWMGQMYGGDPGRIAAQALTGIGFLGAGVIMRYRENTFGLTTAACIWVVSVVGLAVGAGMFIAASAVMLLVLFLLILLFRFEVVRNVDRTKTSIKIVINNTDITSDQIKKIFKHHRLTVSDIAIERDYTGKSTTFIILMFVSGNYNETPLFDELKALPDISAISLGV